MDSSPLLRLRSVDIDDHGSQTGRQCQQQRTLLQDQRLLMDREIATLAQYTNEYKCPDTNRHQRD